MIILLLPLQLRVRLAECVQTPFRVHVPHLIKRVSGCVVVRWGVEWWCDSLPWWCDRMSLWPIFYHQTACNRLHPCVYPYRYRWRWCSCICLYLYPTPWYCCCCCCCWGVSECVSVFCWKKRYPGSGVFSSCNESVIEIIQAIDCLCVSTQCQPTCILAQVPKLDGLVGRTAHQQVVFKVETRQASLMS